MLQVLYHTICPNSASYAATNKPSATSDDSCLCCGKCDDNLRVLVQAFPVAGSKYSTLHLVMLLWETKEAYERFERCHFGQRSNTAHTSLCDTILPPSADHASHPCSGHSLTSGQNVCKTEVRSGFCVIKGSLQSRAGIEARAWQALLAKERERDYTL